MHSFTKKMAVSCAAIASIGLASSASAAAACGCDADYNHSGAIDAADLSLLLGAWGQLNWAVDLSGDGMVDAADLSILLGGWGPCVGPSNDDCYSALLLPVAYDQAVSFCTTDASTDGPTDPLCENSQSNQIYNDLWYHITAPAAGQLELSTCDSNFDTRVAVYAPSFTGDLCPSGFTFPAAMIACNDDTDLPCVNTVASHLMVPVNAGWTYAVRVGGFNFDSGSGVLQATFHEVGDLCSNAIPVTLADPGTIDGVTVIKTGSTAHATPSQDNADPSSCGGTNDSKDIWFKVTVDCQNGGDQPVDFSISTCQPGTDFDTTLAVYTGECGQLTEIDCNDDYDAVSCQVGRLNRKSFVSVSPILANTYYVRLAGWDSETGDYQIKFHFKCLGF